MTCRLRWYLEMETRCRIPIWRTFGQIQWHVIPEPLITLQGAATWWIHWHDSRATYHIEECSHLTKSMSWSCHIAGCKNSIHYIENRFPHILFFLFRLWRAAAFVSSPIHLFTLSLCPTQLSTQVYFINYAYQWHLIKHVDPLDRAQFVLYIDALSFQST